jgi:hypothetical protein
MGMMYVATFSEIAVTAIQDIFEIVAPSDAVVVIHSIYLGQSTEEGDAQDEMLPLQLTKGYTVSGSGGASVTPTPLESGFPAAGSTVERNNTTQANTGTPVELLADAFNVRAGWQYRPTPEERIVLSPSQRLVLELPVAPTDSITLSGSLIFEEIGG